MLMFQVPLAFVPVVLGAPTVLYEIVRAVEPLNVVPDASPAPPLLNVAEEAVLAAWPDVFPVPPAVTGKVPDVSVEELLA
jgi:hypothetical protein